MLAREDWEVPNLQRFGPEVFVADTDALLGDACDAILSGKSSELLRAIDAGSAVGVMSEQTFHELGRMTAPAARGRGVDHEALRARVTTEYLPRVPVVRTPSPDSGQWMPDATGVADPDDVPHVQVARLMSAGAIYSHDKHLRRPRLARPTRAEYDLRMVLLAVLSNRRESERSAGLLVGLAEAGARAGVSWASVRLRARPSLVWSALALVSAIGAFTVLASPERRERVAQDLWPAVGRLNAYFERSSDAGRALHDARLIPVVDTDRLEPRIVSYLVRHPDSTMRAIAEALDLNTAARRQLSSILHAHPSFELVSRYGWAFGRTRNELVTHPSSSWRPPPA